VISLIVSLKFKFKKYRMADNYSQDGFSDGGDDVPVKVSPASFSHSESIFID